MQVNADTNTVSSFLPRRMTSTVKAISILELSPRLLGAETRSGKSLLWVHQHTGLLTGPHCFVLPDGNHACYLHPSITPVLGWQTREGCATLLLLQRLMEFFAGVSSLNESACAGHPHCSCCSVFSSDLQEQLTGWENLNSPTCNTSQTKQHCFYSSAQPTAHTVMNVNLLVVSACKDEILLAARAVHDKGQRLLFFLVKISQSNRQEGCELLKRLSCHPFLQGILRRLYSR